MRLAELSFMAVNGPPWSGNERAARIARAVLGLVLNSFWLAGCEANEVPPELAGPAERATYLGAGACAECHAEQQAAWRGSHHDGAMQVASESTVLGDFTDARFTDGKIISTFFRRDGEFWVNTRGADGRLRDFRITHSLGVAPLQQYLIAFPGGRRQVLSIAWDTRPASQGGQRWFHLYPGEEIDSEDPLHWTGRYQNWNGVCADCHSTKLVRNYDLATDSFETTFASVNVDCEACHGPGSAHVAEPGRNALYLPSTQRQWILLDGAATASLERAGEVPPEIELCARCHSRRSQLSDGHSPGQPLYDGFRPALLEAGLYHADGQILDEVYVYGSFVQSAMYAAGVICSDCHEPHSAELRTEGNTLCALCHAPTVFDDPSHHRHEAGGAGSRCVNCHMRAQTYMGVDPRRDHSFRVPRPDLTVSIGVPNACGDCHGDRGATWAAERVAEGYPGGRQDSFHYGEALHAGRNWSQDRSGLLMRLIRDPEQPAIARATALGLLFDQPDEAALVLLERQLAGSDVVVQLAGVEALSSVPARRRSALGRRFLTHGLRALRMAAARALLPVRGELGERARAELDAALAEYLETQRFNADRAGGLVNMANVFADQGRLDEAERAYRRALEREPAFAAGYVNLAELYRQTGRENEAEALLRNGIALAPDNAALQIALAFSLVRSGRADESLAQFERAVLLDKDDPYKQYLLGVALHSTGAPERAIEVLEAAHKRFPGFDQIRVALLAMRREASRTKR